MRLPPLTPNAWLRYDLIRRILAELEKVQSVVEIGAGEGALGARLARRYDYVGLEPDPISCAKARERLEAGGRGTVICGLLSEVAPERQFDLLCAFEVLEHIEDDGAALREWRTHIRPGGFVLLSVPAFEARWSASDRKAGHYRRYEPEALAGLLTATGYVEQRILMYGFPLGYVLEAARSVLARRSESERSLADATGASGRWLQPPEWAGALTQAGTAPFRLLQRPFVSTRLGTGIVAVARSPAID